ncbi:MAG TPA: copper chaperone PCu(A)C [Alphaproteobacteria bacterium]|jgi:copper(I)-binding protein|nr:copper chaperone PCu(A)C [Alphaproteobacteria bacterium]
MRLAVTLALAAALLSGPALADDMVKVGSLEIEHAWVRPSAGPNGAVYLEIDNKGSAPDRLVAASTSAANKAELHTHVMDGNIARMRPVDAIEVTPGSPTVLKPGGLHIMLLGLKAPLKEGDKVALTLTFEKAGKVDVSVPVQKNAAGIGQGGMDQGTMGGQHMMH